MGTDSAPFPPLESGDRLTSAEFESRYEVMPDCKKAELIEGAVYLGSPVSIGQHGSPHSMLIWWLVTYQVATPGTQVGDNNTVRLDVDNEPQPDAFLRVLPEYGGQSRTSEDGYMGGTPELIAEVAATSASIDLHEKVKALDGVGRQWS